MSSSLLQELQTTIDLSSPQAGLQAIAAQFGERAVFSLGFGKEGMVLLDMISRHTLPIKVFTIDTGRLFPETYELFYQAQQKYQRRIEVYFPESKDVEQLLEDKGPMSFYDSVENRKECCYIRKLKPLRRALTNATIWVTGLRGTQSHFREGMEAFQWHPRHEVIKFNPLINWTTEQVDDYIRTYKVPINLLHHKGYASIGCAPCTRAIQPGEDERAGRWWWEASHKECGLHTEFVQPAGTQKPA